LSRPPDDDVEGPVPAMPWMRPPDSGDTAGMWARLNPVDDGCADHTPTGGRHARIVDGWLARDQQDDTRALTDRVTKCVVEQGMCACQIVPVEIDRPVR
jgi:hypothetical protein